MTVHHDGCLWILMWGWPQQGLASSGEAWQQSTSPRFSVWGARGSPQQFHVKGRAQRSGRNYFLLYFRSRGRTAKDWAFLCFLKQDDSEKWHVPATTCHWPWRLQATSKTPHSPCHLGCWEIHLHTMEWERVRVLRGELTVLWRFLFKISEFALPCGKNRLASLVAQMVKNPPAMQETWVWSLGQEDPLEEDVATHSSILTWRIHMDRGSWWAMVHGVVESWTRLNDSTQCVTQWWPPLEGTWIFQFATPSAPPAGISICNHPSRRRVDNYTWITQDQSEAPGPGYLLCWVALRLDSGRSAAVSLHRSEQEGRVRLLWPALVQAALGVEGQMEGRQLSPVTVLHS